MGGVNGEFLDESVSLRFVEGGSAAATTEVLKLREPWIADEGPLSAELWQHGGGELKRPLDMRGIAFDDRVTVQWDEDAVQVIEAAGAESGVLARRSDVLVRKRLHSQDKPNLVTAQRIDYLRAGVLIASRYVPGSAKGEADA